MNDLMTKSFLSYVELKKQAMMDLEAGPDIEMGQLDPTDERNLTKFFEEVAVIKSDMEEINNLLVNLQDLNQKTKSAPSAKILQGLRDQINSDIITVLRKAKIIKTRLELLDKSNLDNRGVSAAYKEGSPVDRTRISVTNGLRIKLRDMMNDFQCLRENIVAEHKEGLRKQYSNANGKEPSEEAIEKMMEERVFEGRVEKGAVENQDRHEAVKEIQKSLIELHQVFLDMAVMVETQGDQMNNIEQNVVNAGGYVNGGMKELDRANRMKRTRTWACWIGALYVHHASVSSLMAMDRVLFSLIDIIGLCDEFMLINCLTWNYLAFLGSNDQFNYTCCFISSWIYCQWNFHLVLSLSSDFAVYVPDILFFGDSFTIHPERSTSFQAECLARGMMQLGVEKFNLVGFCYGSMIGFKVAQLYPYMVISSGVNCKAGYVCKPKGERGT
ncbi:hypothetical protein H5410_010192 [Solanum commersonii]|uniref:t-SNARE coiled-coil homology domain-containing protein n=1 Tax=Solanum commersonii TaxID=4109 RepID=A0A9J6AK22_SOLCO|nr:hypothetical protein H5410_010192 [Solanum commersonii]